MIVLCSLSSKPFSTSQLCKKHILIVFSFVVESSCRTRNGSRLDGLEQWPNNLLYNKCTNSVQSFNTIQIRILVQLRIEDGIRIKPSCNFNCQSHRFLPNGTCDIFGSTHPSKPMFSFPCWEIWRGDALQEAILLSLDVRRILRGIRDRGDIHHWEIV